MLDSGTRSEARLTNATFVPSGLTTGVVESRLAAPEPVTERDTRVVVPVERSRTKTFQRPAVSSGTRLVACDAKATMAPLALTDSSAVITESPPPSPVTLGLSSVLRHRLGGWHPAPTASNRQAAPATIDRRPDIRAIPSPLSMPPSRKVARCGLPRGRAPASTAAAGVLAAGQATASTGSTGSTGSTTGVDSSRNWVRYSSA